MKNRKVIECRCHNCFFQILRQIFTMKIIKNLALSDTGFVFNPSTGDSFSVNPIGLGILRDFKDGKSEEDIKKRMLLEYQTDTETIEKDLYDFMKMIEQFNLTEYNDQA